MNTNRHFTRTVTRRTLLRQAIETAGLASLLAAADSTEARAAGEAPVATKDPLQITRLETFLVKPRWLFLKIHTDAGMVGLGEPILEGRALTCAPAVEEIAPYLVGKDPRRVVHHWQAMYRHAFYRGGPILTSALSGIDQALWDITGKALGVPVYELLGGPTRDRIRLYAHARSVEAVKQAIAKGFTAFKTASGQAGPRGSSRARASSTTWPRALPHCARPAGRRSTSPSISTARSPRRPPSC